MDANFEALKRIEAAIEVELKRHRRNLGMLTNAAEILRTLVADRSNSADVTVEVVGTGDHGPAEKPSTSKPVAQKEQGPVGGKALRGLRDAISGVPRRRIVTVGAAAKPKWGRTAGATAAIKEAIRYFGDETFTTGEILTYVRQHHPNIPLDAGTIAKRIFQLRRIGLIQVVIKAKPGTRSAQTYKRTLT